MERTRRIKDILWFFTFFGLIAMIFRLYFGLGATTNLSDAVPWGLWKILNMVAGAALATSGFTIGFLAHVLKIKKLERLIKPAILIAFLGYGSSLAALLFDIGLPQSFWHPFIYWNPHSFLFEVFWCVSCYFIITFLELTPTLLERIGLGGIRNLLHKASPGIVIFGITLSCMHHTSLGSLFLVTPTRLYGLWYTPRIPLFFIMTAMAGGLFLFTFIVLLYRHWYSPPKDKHTSITKTCKPMEKSQVDAAIPELDALRLITSIAAVILTIYLVLKLLDMTILGQWQLLLKGTWESWLFGFEILIEVLIPIVLIALSRTRHSVTGLGIAAFSGAFGLAMNRLDVGILGYFRDAGVVYWPSLGEWVICFGVLSMAGLAFFFIVENFSIFGDAWRQRLETRDSFVTAFDRLSHVWKGMILSGVERVTIIATIAVPLAWMLCYPPFQQKERIQVIPPLAVDSVRATLRIDGNRSSLSARFNHLAHQEHLGNQSSCVLCHHISLPGDKATPCSRCHQSMENSTVIFNHEYHTVAVSRREKLTGLHPENRSCNYCHDANSTKTASSAKSCVECHADDMSMNKQLVSNVSYASAVSYREAMHQTCIPCHQEKQLELNRPTLGECATCHSSLRTAEYSRLMAKYDQQSEPDSTWQVFSLNQVNVQKSN